MIVFFYHSTSHSLSNGLERFDGVSEFNTRCVRLFIKGLCIDMS